MNFLDLIWLIPLFPAAGFVFNGIFGKRISKTAVGVIASGAVLASFIFASGAVLQLMQLEESERSHEVTVYQWIDAGPAVTRSGEVARFAVDWGFLLDPLSSVMVLVVTGIGFLIHVYSIGYMKEEDGFYRFFAYLNLFMFSMLTLILGKNYLMMFIGWEGVGLCSYLLIGYYFLKKSAGDAAKKAFVVNRVGDWGLSIGIMLIFISFGSLDFTVVGERIREGVVSGQFQVSDPLFIGIALALFVGATGKSAQIPLFVWLPDAMEGPTPVSALIHAATMVTAGVYMVARSNWIYQMAPEVLTVVAIIGALTALFAASIGMVQNDIKRVLAYSTVSQLGYMFLALGVGAFAAGIFHLMTHAFFKALLFLGSGSVIHAMHHEQDMRRMGGLKNKIPITFFTMAIGTLAIAGTPGLAGFFSKDEILWQALSSPHGHVILWLIGAIVAGMTAFYMFRLLFMTFFGESRVDPHVEHHIHESPRSMTVPLIVLAVGSVLAGYIGLPVWLGGSAFEHWLEPVFEPLPIAAAPVVEHSHAFEIGMAAVSVAIALIGFLIAYTTYYKKSDRADRVAARFKGLYNALLHKWYIDELYDALWVNRAKDTGNGLWRFDAKVVDGVVNGSAWVSVRSALGSGWWDRWIVDGLVGLIAGFIKTVSWPVRLIETGYAQNYALLMVLGVLVLVGYALWDTSNGNSDLESVMDFYRTHILSIVAFWPLVGMFVLFFFNKENKNLIRLWANIVAVTGFFISLPLWFWFDRNTADQFQFQVQAPWIQALGADFHVGIDGITLLLVLLTTLLGPLAVLSSWDSIKDRTKEYYAFMLMLQAGMLGVFISLDFFMFYVFWEVMLVPMYFLIGVWGGPRKLYAALKFFLYTLFGSVLLLLGILALYFNYPGIAASHPEIAAQFGAGPTFNVLAFHAIAPYLSFNFQFWTFLAFFVGFAIKVPMFPFHTWLPDAHVEAPTAGSVILAGVLLKMGTYGFLRFSLPILPAGTTYFVPMMIALSIVAIIYGALVAMMQPDMKKLVAYSSVSHMGFVMLGMFALNPNGLNGSIIQQINHGISTGALFLIVGIIYERRHTREISQFGGLSSVMPNYAIVFLIMTMSSIGLPLLNGFIGEFPIMMGVLQENVWWAVAAGSGIVLGAAYMLWLYQRTMFGKLDNPANMHLPDLSMREWVTLIPLIIMAFWIGLYPKPFFDVLDKPVNNLVLKVRPDYFKGAPVLDAQAEGEIR